MDTLVRLNAEEMNQSFIDFIKTSFKGKRIAVHIYEDDTDETTYLLSDPVHREKLLRTVEEVNESISKGVHELNQPAITKLKERIL